MLSINAVDPSLVSSSKKLFQRRGQKFIIHYPCASKSQCTLISVTFPKGIYKIECWGASGGDRSESVKDGGRGAYTSGEIVFFSRTTLYLSIGASGDAETNGTYGGGGHYKEKYVNTRTGGGATDVRTIQNEDFEGLKHRIMVAAGGGGAVNHGSVGSAGHGGDINGSIGCKTFDTKCSPYGSMSDIIAATQTSGAISSKGDQEASNGEFGKGGSYLGRFSSGTGGGGYYVGGSGNFANCVISTGSGGSSYISGYQGCDSINESSTRENIFHTGSCFHFSGFSFVSAEMKNGQQDVPEPSLYSSAIAKGRTGNGCVKITVLSSQFFIHTCANRILPLTTKFCILLIQCIT